MSSKKISSYFEIEALALKSKHFNKDFVVSVASLFNSYTLKSQDYIKKMHESQNIGTLEFSENSYLFEHSEEV